MAKTKKATPSPVDEKVYDGSFTYTDLNGKEVEVKYNLYVPLVDMCACINNIVDAVIDDSGYMPYFYDIALYANFFEAYTDFDTSVGFEKVNEILCNTDIKNILSKHVLLQPFNAIKDSVDKMIEYRKQHSIKSEIDDMFRVGKELLIKASTAFDELLGSDTLNPETIQKMVGNLANMQVSEKGLIDALVSTTKGKGGRPKRVYKGGTKDNVVDLPPIGQQKMDGSEVLE